MTSVLDAPPGLAGLPFAGNPVKGSTVLPFGAALRQADGRSDGVIDCRGSNAISVWVQVQGAPGATLTVEGSSTGQGSTVLPDPNATKASVNATAIFDVMVGQPFVRLRLAGGTYTAGAGYLIMVTPYLAASQTNLSVTNTASSNLAQVGGVAVSPGQKAMAASLPVAIASDQSALPTADGRLPAALGQATMATSLPVAVASDQGALPVQAARGSKSAPTTVTVGAAAVQVLAANANRKSALFVQLGTGTVYLGRDTTVTTANGIPLQPASGTTPGGSLADTTSTDAWWAIGSAGGQDLRVLETA